MPRAGLIEWWHVDPPERGWNEQTITQHYIDQLGPGEGCTCGHYAADHNWGYLGTPTASCRACYKGTSWVKNTIPNATIDTVAVVHGCGRYVHECDDPCKAPGCAA